MGKSLFMIKPEGMEYADEIINAIQDNNIRIVEKRKITMTQQLLQKIYKDQSGLFWEANRDYLVDKQCILAIVECENVENRLFTLCGVSFKPEECEKGTIRERYGIRKPLTHSNGKALYLNCIHRSSPENAEYEVGIYYDYFRKEDIL